MFTLRNTVLSLACAIGLIDIPVAQAAIVNFQFTGTVDFNEIGYPDPTYNIDVGQVARVFGQYDNSGITGVGNEYIYFGAGTGNHFTIELAWHTYSEIDDVDWIGGTSPAIGLSSGMFQSFSFYLDPTVNIDRFSSQNQQFTLQDDYNNVYGYWDPATFDVTLSSVPLPPAVGLLGSGLLGLIGVAKFKKS